LNKEENMGSANAGIRRTRHSVWLPIVVAGVPWLRLSQWWHYSGTTSGERNGPVVVFLHGLSGHHDNLHLVTTRVVQELGGEVWVCRLGGHGFSSMPMHFDDLTGMVLAAMESLGVPKGAIVVGHSLGGMTGVRAAELSDWFYHVIAVDSPVREAHSKMGYPRLMAGLGVIGADLVISIPVAIRDGHRHGHLLPNLKSLAGMFVPPTQLAFVPLHTLLILRDGVRKATASAAQLPQLGIALDIVEGAWDIGLHGADETPITVLRGLGHCAPVFKRGADAVFDLITQAHHRRMAAVAA
jgi:pimeloyl-ACP methyl ester carboxylesterase